MGLICGERKISTLVLDFDETMYNAPPEMWIGMRLSVLSMLYGREISLEDEEYLEYVDMAEQQAIGWLPAYEQLGGDLEDFARGAQMFSKVEYVEYDPELETVLVKLSKHVERIVVFTGAYHEPVEDALKKILGIEGFKLISIIVGADDLHDGLAKPSQEAYMEFLNELGIEPESAVLVDDQPREIRSAIAVGMLGLLVGVHDLETIEDLQGVAIVQKVHEVFDVFEIV